MFIVYCAGDAYKYDMERDPVVSVLTSEGPGLESLNERFMLLFSFVESW